MAQHNQTGSWGEDAAVELLVSKGYDIMERNWRLEHLEIDIIARKNDRIVFVEVKTRSSEEFADPLTAVTKKKISNMCKCANAYMHQYDLKFAAQFDVVLVIGNPLGYKIEHIPDAFYPPLRTYR